MKKVSPVHVTVKLVSIPSTRWLESTANIRQPAYVLRMEGLICRATTLLSVLITESVRVMLSLKMEYTLGVFARLDGQGKNT